MTAFAVRMITGVFSLGPPFSAFIICFVCFQPDPQAYVSAFRIFDGVGQKIHQHLPDPDIISSMPRTVFIGVLISWDILARKYDFALLALSAIFFFKGI